MNKFELRINSLRKHYKAERMQIQQECDNYFTRINKVIDMVDDADIRRVLRAEKNRVWKATRRSIGYSIKNYRQQLAIANAEYQLWLEQNPSKSSVRRAMALLSTYAENNETTSFGIAFGDHKHGEVTFK